MEAATGAASSHVKHSQEGESEAKASLAATRAVRGYTEIRSPADGVITQRLLSPGVLVSPGQAILKVAQVRPIRLQANVPEADLARIRPGLRVRITQHPTPNTPLETRVAAVFPAVDPAARTGIVEALLPNSADRILPGQFVTMEVVFAERPGALRVPAAALRWQTAPSLFGQTGKQQASVWLAEPGASRANPMYYCPMHPEVRSRKPGVCPKCKMDLVPEHVTGRWRARRVDVTTGLSDGRFTEITGGLQPGDRVVVEGHADLHNGDALEPAAGSVGSTPPTGIAPGAGTPQPSTLNSPTQSVGTRPSTQGRYYCPMHPEVVSDDPKAKCAKCNGMQLVPRPGA
jgi:multidrug efflux pump subunit AcrA (membrane-fusion protein)